ncbi:MAG: ankyrin repeat domain-containing protein [Flavobacteriaceae bacterium]|nr:ankyrin repeat domain-containing protein [Flavobacteriaceae bacterium]
MVKLLISKGADIEATDDYGQTALNKSYWSNNQELIDYFEKEVY